MLKGKHPAQYRIVCIDCGARGARGAIKDVRAAWNRRVSDSVKYGHWIQVGDTKHRCSVCDDTCLIAQYLGSPNFCPNCGVVMDGERETL